MKETINCSVCGSSCPVKRRADGTASARCPECKNTMMLSKATVARFDADDPPPPAPALPEPAPAPELAPKKNQLGKSLMEKFYDGEL
jgi:hypothetical protein